MKAHTHPERAWMRRIVLLISFACSAACASAPAPIVAQTPDGASRTSVRDTVPLGGGTLKQDEITMSIRTGPLMLKVTPLHESVIRLTAPDTYRRLHALADSRRAEASRGLGDQELFLVSFFSNEPDVTFQPEDVQLTHQGKSLRPEAIVPVTPGWGQQRMQQQETQTAIYAFEGPLDHFQDITLRYGMEQTDVWRGIITRLETELGKVKSRVGS